MNNPLQIRNSFLYRWDFPCIVTIWCRRKAQYFLGVFTGGRLMMLHWICISYLFCSKFLSPVFIVLVIPLNYNRGYFYILSSVSIYRIITGFEVYLRSSDANHYCMGMKKLWNMKFSLLSRKNSVKVGWNLLPQMLSYPRYGGKAPEITSVSVISIVTVCGYC